MNAYLNIVVGTLDLSQLRFAVIDECDTLLDDSFSKPVTSILKHFNVSSLFIYSCFYVG